VNGKAEKTKQNKTNNQINKQTNKKQQQQQKKKEIEGKTQQPLREFLVPRVIP